MLSTSPKVMQPSQVQIKAGVEIMLSGVQGIPDHLALGMTYAQGIVALLKSSVQRVTLCALGGSAFPGELIKVLGAEYDLPFKISRSYRVERGTLNHHDLVIVSSFSGNTEETLSSLQDAMTRGAQVVLMCAGGKLEQLALEHHLPLIKIQRPSLDFQPRAASGFILGALASLLEDLKLLPHARSRLLKVADELRELMNVENEAEHIASALEGKIPVFYAPSPYAESLARIVKIKMNENAKIPSFWNEIPEFNHNEMVGYTRLNTDFIAVFFDDLDAPPRMRQRIMQSVSTLTQYQVATLIVPIREAQDQLTRLLATLYLFDVVSCKLAMRAEIDPNPVAMIEEFKVALGSHIE